MPLSSYAKTAQHLMHLIVTRNANVPNFALFLGSGASVTSGVRTAEDMIEDWRRLLFKRSSSTIPYDTWLTAQSWSHSDDEYSLLFEEIYDQPLQRRAYIEEVVKDGHPSWGYVYLTNFLANRIFDVVFTTNFDDLLNEACYLYSDGLRPIVAAHDSAIQGIRVTSGRPKLIKLHGDFLYDNIKNTLAELETLEANTKKKLGQFAQEYGLVVLGYSGRDRSVMDTLELLLRDEDNYKQGVYWCQRRGAEVSGRLESLLRKDRVYLVDIDGFDEFAADLHAEADLSLPRPISRPFDMARDRARLFVDVRPQLKEHSIIGKDIRRLLMGLNTHIPVLPLSVEAATLAAKGEVEKALIVWDQAYEEDPHDIGIAGSYAEALLAAGKHEKLAQFVPDSPLSDDQKIYLLLRAEENELVVDLASEVLNMTSKSHSDASLDKAYIRINRAIALKRLDRIEEMERDLETLGQDGSTADINLRAGVAALRGNKEEMFIAIEQALGKSLSSHQLVEFPVFEDYRDDPEFRRLIERAMLE